MKTRLRLTSYNRVHLAALGVIAFLAALCILLSGCDNQGNGNIRPETASSSGAPTAADQRVEVAKQEVKEATTKAATLSARLELAEANLAKDKELVTVEQENIKSIKKDIEAERQEAIQHKLRVWSALAAAAGVLLIGIGLWLGIRNLIVGGGIALIAAALCLTSAWLVPYFWWLSIGTSVVVALVVLYELVVRHQTLTTFVNEAQASGRTLSGYTPRATKLIDGILKHMPHPAVRKK